MNAINVKFKRLHPDAVIPKYATELAAGFDFVAVDDVIIAPGETALVPTGLAFELPQGYEMQVRPRSGVSLRTKLRVGNSPGTVDADFRGEVNVIIDNISIIDDLCYLDAYVRLDGTCSDAHDGVYTDLNHGAPHIEFNSYYVVRKGDRIAQGVIAPVFHAVFEEVTELGETERGTGGFGHTGVRTCRKAVAE